MQMSKNGGYDKNRLVLDRSLCFEMDCKSH